MSGAGYKSTVFIDDDAVTIIGDDDLLAIRQHGRVEVWRGNGETHLGNMPAHATEPEIRAAARFWMNGFTEGIKAGRDEAQAKLRDALGLGA